MLYERLSIEVDTLTGIVAVTTMTAAHVTPLSGADAE